MRRRVLNSVGFSIGFITTVLSIVLSISALSRAADADALAWPPITPQSQPWTRWWWMGSAVDKENLTSLLNQYHQAGIGGVEICPIYGASGYENRYIPYLSPKWMAALSDTTAAAQTLNMGVDMTTGTGWPMGGPNVSIDDASSTVQLRRVDVADGANLSENITGGRLQCVCAYSEAGDRIDLTSKVKDGTIHWTPLGGAWKVYIVTQRGPAMQVKRAAPGGEGNVLDPFSTKSIKDFLGRFDTAFAAYKGILPESQFHDSYEYIGDWTNNLFAKFQSLRGYDLRLHLPELMGEGDPDTVARVLCDYRQTMADLHGDYLSTWIQWCHNHGMMAREQAHGAPANLLDLYAQADIPETEVFRDVNADENMPVNKFASSAAHVTGKRLTSSESFTWLNEHFQTPLSQIKPMADYLFLSGINHIFLHGMAYSPKDVPWPGWLFYASVDFNPNGGLWHDLPAFNAYVARCQSILQSGKPSNDVLLYFPLYDFWQVPQGALIQFPIAGTWLHDQPFNTTALSLAAHGFGVDYVSDAQLANATVDNGQIIVGGNAYRAIVLPHCHYMPPETAAYLVNLAAAGATVVVQDNLPQDVQGLANLNARRAQLHAALRQIPLPPALPGKPAQGAPVGKGYFWIGSDPNAVLAVANIGRESMVDQGLRFIRRSHETGYNYFIVNRGDHPVDGWVTLATPARSAVLLDPMFPDRVGVAALRRDASSRPQVYLQLQPGESRFVRTFIDRDVAGPGWHYWQKADEPLDVSGVWNVHFTEGGPVLPADYSTEELGSWTAQGNDEAKRFAGTARYSIDFEGPAAAGAAKDWLLDLGRVGDSVRVRVNGQGVGTVISQPFQIHLVSLLHPGKNHLEFDVTNLAANRIADLDRRGVKWKIFHDINIVGIDYQPFDASKWPLRDSGLIGPVTLTPLLPLETSQAK